MTPEQEGRLLEAVERIDKRCEKLEDNVEELKATKNYWTGLAAGLGGIGGVAGIGSAIATWFKH